MNKRTIVPETLKDSAIFFLVPSLSEQSNVEAINEISNFIDSKFKRLHTCVLYRFNEEFMRILSKYDLSIGDKEIIINDGAVLGTDDFRKDPKVMANSPQFLHKITSKDDDEALIASIFG